MLFFTSFIKFGLWTLSTGVERVNSRTNSEGRPESFLSIFYHPIAITSCLRKLLEKMINRRLIYLEYHGILDCFQAGFRSGRCTTDQLVALESYIKDAFVHRQHCMSIFFDLEKGYDTAWRYGILRDLKSYGVSGNMLNTLESYLSERIFRVRVGAALSEIHTQENGVPQGCVLSCTLFIINMNTLRKALSPTIFYSVCVDDIHISFKSCNLSICERQVQLGAKRKWADENGFKVNTEKSTCVLFSRQRGMKPDPDIILNGAVVLVKKKYTFLGVVLDDKLTFILHIKLKNKWIRAICILKILSHQSYGADKTCLVRLFDSLVRSRLDYGSVVYGSATKTALKMFEYLSICIFISWQNQGEAETKGGRGLTGASATRFTAYTITRLFTNLSIIAQS